MNPLESIPYRRYLGGVQARFLGFQAANVAIGYELYEQTGSAMALGLVGLFHYIPIFLFSLPAGVLADRVDRQRILKWTTLFGALCLAGLCALAFFKAAAAWWYLLIFLWAASAAFHTPAAVSFYPTLIRAESLPRAVMFNSANFQFGAIVGPALGGLLVYLGGAPLALGFGAAGFFIYLAQLGRIRPLKPFVPHARPLALAAELTDGLRFVWNDKAMFGALSLDFVSVLFGGVEGIMPIFAKDILGVGPIGLGFLKAAPFAGALCMSLLLSQRQLIRHAGRDMLVSVALFGASMLVFALSKSLALSLAALFFSGVMDQVSVWVRQTMVQVRTPEGLRGRVQSVNFLFIGSSNELGEFESGAAAAWLGAVPSVLMGGAAVIGITAAWAYMFPKLRKLKKLELVT